MWKHGLASIVLWVPSADSILISSLTSPHPPHPHPHQTNIRRFKALQNLVKIHFALKNSDLMIERYRAMLGDMPLVSRNEINDAISSILEMLSAGTEEASQTLIDMFEISLEAAKNNDRLWFSINKRLANLYLDLDRIQDVEALISQLKATCRLPSGEDDPSKGGNLLEVYCLEIQLCTLTQNTTRMRQIYPRTVHLNAAVADPRVMGIIREEGGKMHMSEGSWDEAYNELYEAFRNFQEAGNTPRAKACLRYVVLASMLALTSINPFAAREAKVFAEDKEVLAMSDLRQSLEANDLRRFERVLQNKQNHIMDEPIIMTYVQPLRRRMREQVLLSLVRPYQKVTLAFLSRELSLPGPDVEALLVDMILDGQLSAQIDQIRGFVVLGGNRETTAEKKLRAIGKWADNLVSIHENTKGSFY